MRWVADAGGPEGFALRGEVWAVALGKAPITKRKVTSPIVGDFMKSPPCGRLSGLAVDREQRINFIWRSSNGATGFLPNRRKNELGFGWRWVQGGATSSGQSLA